MDRVPQAVQVRNLVGHELDHEQGGGRDHDIGPLKRSRHALDPAEPAEQPGHQHHQVRVDAAGQAAGDDQRQRRLHGYERTQPPRGR